MTLDEREELLAASVAESDCPLDPNRFAFRRRGGEIEWFRTLLTLRHDDGRIEIHGHPFTLGYPKIPVKVLRAMRDSGALTNAEYRRATRQ